VVVDAFIAEMGGDVRRKSKADPVARPTEQFFGSLLAGVGVNILSAHVDDPYGMARVDPAWLATLTRGLPIIGSEVHYYADPLVRLYADRTEGVSPEQTIAGDIAYLLGQYTGVLKKTLHNPGESERLEREQMQRGFTERANTLERERHFGRIRWLDSRGRLVDD